MRKVLLLLLLPLFYSCSSRQGVGSQDGFTYTTKAPKPYNGRTIVLDAGHGGFDMGANQDACEEKNLNLTTTLLVKRYLNHMGYRVVLTRSRDLFVPLKERAQMANSAQGMLFVSLHYNGHKNSSAEGIEVFYYLPKSGKTPRSAYSEKLATSVLNQLLAATHATSRGVKAGNFLVIRETKMPAILVEGGFITNEKERARLNNPKYLHRIAKAVARGVDSYFETNAAL